MVYTVGFILSTLLYFVAMLFLYFWRFAYSEDPESGFITALKKSRCCILIAVPTLILFSALYFIIYNIYPIVNQTYSHLSHLIIFTYSALRNWIGFTIYYMAVSGGIKLKIFEKTIQKISGKGAEAAKTAVYNIGGNYVHTQNTFAGNDDIGEENDK